MFSSSIQTTTKAESKAAQIDAGSEFLMNTIYYPTICISICTLNSGGCHSFGENLASGIEADYCGFAEKPQSFLNIFDLLMQGPSATFDVFKQKTTPFRQYVNVCFTGCLCDEGKAFSYAAKILDFTQVKNIWLIAPSHLALIHYNTLEEIQQTFHLHSQYKIALLSSGIETDLSHYIGIPNPFPIITSSSEVSLPEHCFGLVYIRDLIYNTASAGMEPYLDRYFSQVSKIATQKLITTPSVLIIANDENEKETYKAAAGKLSVTVTFVDRLAPEHFIDALKKINSVSGIVACNGGQTFIQGTLLGCKTLFYANKRCNHELLKRLVDLVDSSLKETARVILGFGSESSLLDNHENTRNIYNTFQQRLQTGVDQFAQTKNKYLKEKKDALPEYERTDYFKGIDKSSYGDVISLLTRMGAIKMAPINPLEIKGVVSFTHTAGATREIRPTYLSSHITTTPVTSSQIGLWKTKENKANEWESREDLMAILSEAGLTKTPSLCLILNSCENPDPSLVIKLLAKCSALKVNMSHLLETVAQNPPVVIGDFFHMLRQFGCANLLTANNINRTLSYINKVEDIYNQFIKHAPAERQQDKLDAIFKQYEVTIPRIVKAIS